MCHFWLYIIVCCHINLYNCLDFEWGSLKENAAFVEVDCDIFPNESYCNNESNGWCKWDGSKCYKNYNPLLFSSTVDIILVSRGLSTYIYLSGLMILYWISGILVNKLKMFKRLDSDKLNKCQIYIFELFALSAGLAYILYTNIYGIFYNANDFSDITPGEAMTLTRGIAGAFILAYIYAIEMLTNNLRWSLQLHHIVSIVSGAYYLFLMNDFVDFAALRSTLAMSLYSFTEHNVFIQLLLYRTNPLFSWKVHLISSIFYVFTRFFAIYTFLFCYYEWAISDEIYDELHGNKPKHYAYLIHFFLLPIMNILLNIAQYQTVRALFYLTFSVKKRIKQRNELEKYHRLQELYDIFIEFDEEDNGYWTMMDWKKFIFYHSTFIKHDTCIILWNVLGFEYTEHESNGIMAQISDLAHQLSDAIGTPTPKPNENGLTDKEIDDCLETMQQESENSKSNIENIENIEIESVIQLNIEMTAIDINANTIDIDTVNNNGESNRVRAGTFNAADINEYESHIKEKKKNKDMSSPIPKRLLKKKKYMKWKHLKQIFGPNLKSKKYENYTIKQVISASIQVLLKTIFSAQSDYESHENMIEKRNTMKKLYVDIDELIGKHQSQSQINVILENEEEIEKNNNNQLKKDKLHLNRIISYGGINNETIMDKQLQLNTLVTQHIGNPTQLQPNQTF